MQINVQKIEKNSINLYYLCNLLASSIIRFQTIEYRWQHRSLFPLKKFSPAGDKHATSVVVLRFCDLHLIEISVDDRQILKWQDSKVLALTFAPAPARMSRPASTCIRSKSWCNSAEKLRPHFSQGYKKLNLWCRPLAAFRSSAASWMATNSPFTGHFPTRTVLQSDTTQVNYLIIIKLNLFLFFHLFLLYSWWQNHNWRCR